MDWFIDNWEKIGVIYLLLIKLITAIRDVIDKTPATDDNFFEKMVTVLNSTLKYLVFGKRPA